MRMPGLSGIDLFRELRRRDPDLPVVLMTGHGDIDMAVDLIKAGAWDFLTKPFDPDALIAAATRALHTRALTLENRHLRALAQDDTAPEFLGQSEPIRRLRAMIPMIASTDMDVLIEGETGTGKGLLAQLLHRSGKRARRRFLTLSCTGMDETLVARAFGPAPDPTLLGLDRGTLCLDAIERAGTALQDRLIAFLETRTIDTGRNAVPLDLRLIATSAPLGEHAEALQPALFYRLAGIRLQLPPLRERREDIFELFAHFAGQTAQRLGGEVPALSDAVRAHLAAHDWPGNLRELRNYAELFVMGLSTFGAPAPLSGEIAQAHPEGPLDSLPERVEAFERAAIIAAVRACSGEIGAAIRALGLPRKTFYYKVAKHGIDLAALRKAGG
ncbi:sigma-54-dependent transcriptional regulator [Novosphingobium organovorum]